MEWPDELPPEFYCERCGSFQVASVVDANEFYCERCGSFQPIVEQDTRELLDDLPDPVQEEA